MGAAHEVTGSCSLLEAAGKKILIDCGMEQGPDIYQNCSLPVAANDIDYVLLTHAHIDHSGKLPVLIHDGYSGNIYATLATCKLCEIMLMDSAHIQESEAMWRNRKAQRSGADPFIPMYTIEDAQRTLTHFSPCSYNAPFQLDDNISVKFIDAGHLLGSSSIEITVTENGETKTLLFSGDLGNVDRPIIRDPQKPENADYVVIESTYGTRLHGERPDYMTQLTKIVQETLDAGGNVVIPSFAVGRTQELLFIFREIKEKNLVKGHGNFEVWIDSPLAVEATHIYDSGLLDYYDDDMRALIEKGIDVLQFSGLHVAVTSYESAAINDNPNPKVIISASGMCEAGRIRHHLKHNLWKQNSTVLFVGYQAEGTLGRRIIEGAKSVKLFGEEIAVNARIETMKGISGHADQRILLNWLGALKNKPTMVFVNHGGDTVCDEFAEIIHESLGYEALAPYNGASYDLGAVATCIDEGNKVRIVKKQAKDRTAFVFDRLVAAGRRLMSVIEKNKGVANKDIAKFTSQINELSNKWDR